LGEAVRRLIGSAHTIWGKIIAVPEGIFTTSGYGFNVRKRTEIPWVAAKVTELDQQQTGSVST